MVHPRLAAAAPDGRHLLESTAALVVRLDPAELERGAAFVRSLGGEAAGAAGLASLASASVVGFDPLAVSGWRGIGADADQPVWLQIDRSVAGASDLVHLRAAVRIADGARATAWARALPMVERPWTGEPPKGKSPLADHLGGLAPADLETAARELAARGTLAAGRVRGTNALLLVRRVGAFLVLDALWTPREGALRWTNHHALVLERLDAPRAGAGHDLASAGGAGAQLLDRPGLAVWSRPGGALDLGRTLLDAPLECDDHRLRATAAAITDAALSLRVGPQRLQLDLAWGVAEGVPLAAALAPRDDGLFAPRRQAGAVLSAGIYLPGVAALRELPRAAAVDAGWSPLWRRARPCGTAARVDLTLFAWPELAAQWLAETAALSPGAAALVASARNVAFAARRVSARDRRDWVVAAEASLDGAGRPVVEAILDAVFGGRAAARRPRAHTAWAGSILRPYLLPGSARRPDVVGVGVGAASLAWRLRHPGAAPRRAAGTTFARAAGDAAALLRQLAPDLGAPWSQLATTAAARVGSFQGSIAAERAAVRASFILRRR
ncbi:MAG TPA: hypothetical protein VMZ28_15325 [Kofleriaceae bacterium]|nr:hypothetical protein [Kofleriaceae bacterium]